MARHVSFLFLFYLFLTGCGDTPELRDDRTVFRYNESKGITSLDPAFARNQTNIWPVSQLFNGLVQLDDDLLVRPCIAKGWEVNDDGTLYTFYLRTDVLFLSLIHI